MTTYRETIKSLLLNYPSLFSNKLAVNAQLFAVIGNGYEWSAEGTLEKDISQSHNNHSMRFEDLDKEIEFIKEKHRDWNAFLLAQIESKRIMRQFMADHIELILDESCSREFFSEWGYNQKLYTYMEPQDVSYSYARVFHYPENIRKDWARGLEDFVSVWMGNLRTEYRIGQTGKEMNHWPEEAKILYNRLDQVHDDLMNKITGEDKETRHARLKLLADELLKDLDI